MRAYAQRARAQARERTAAAIDRAVLRELRVRRYEGLRLAEVAARAGVALRTVYLHSPSKEVAVLGALRRRAAALERRVERWRPPEGDAAGILDSLVTLHERTYRSERALLEVLLDSGAPGGAEVLRSLDLVRLAIIERAVAAIAGSGALRSRTGDAVALAHALLAYPTWRAALTGPARRRAPRLIAEVLKTSALLSPAPRGPR